MKKIVVIICLSLLLKPVLPVIDYVFNYEYVATVLCVNKAKPKMHCNGKCHLMKELAKASESEKPISSDKKHTPSESNDLYFLPFETISRTYSPETYHSVNSRYNNLYTCLNSQRVFHPPTFLS